MRSSLMLKIFRLNTNLAASLGNHKATATGKANSSDVTILATVQGGSYNSGGNNGRRGGSEAKEGYRECRGAGCAGAGARAGAKLCRVFGNQQIKS